MKEVIVAATPSWKIILLGDYLKETDAAPATSATGRSRWMTILHLHEAQLCLRSCDTVSYRKLHSGPITFTFGSEMQLGLSAH
jgi:hypothetical protein